MQHAIIMATVWVDDDKIKSDCNFKKKTWELCVCVVKQNDEMSDTNDDVKTKTNTTHMKRDTWQVNVHVAFLLVRVVVILTHCTPHRVVQGSSVCTHLIHAWSERHSSTLSSPFHPTSYSSYSPSISSSSCCPSTSTRIFSNAVYSAKKEVGSTDESCSLTQRTNYLHVVVQWHQMKIWRQWTGMHC